MYRMTKSLQSGDLITKRPTQLLKSAGQMIETLLGHYRPVICCVF
ncbi:hypothetical protein [Faecalispora anaeroviscerum]|nr:hypothetical protein [Faecalispora anaeroviscerum]